MEDGRNGKLRQIRKDLHLYGRTIDCRISEIDQPIVVVTMLNIELYQRIVTTSDLTQADCEESRQQCTLARIKLII